MKKTKVEVSIEFIRNDINCKDFNVARNGNFDSTLLSIKQYFDSKNVIKHNFLLNIMIIKKILQKKEFISFMFEP